METPKAVGAAARKLVDATAVATSRALRYPVVTGKLLHGALRHPGSRAADDYRAREAARLKKALQAVAHGRHIFAYHHLRTNQVVYSLSRTLEQSAVLAQLVYHGKKTVPARLRKDLWAPYFSLHFAAPRTGLAVYRLLREFALLRQFSPPPDAITYTEAYLARKRPRDPLKAEEFDRTHARRVGHVLPAPERARVLMDQKASSVADAARAVELVCEEEQRAEAAAAARESRKRELRELKAQAARAEQEGRAAEPAVAARIEEIAQQLAAEAAEAAQQHAARKKLSKKAKAKAELARQREAVRSEQARARLGELEHALAAELSHVERAAAATPAAGAGSMPFPPPFPPPIPNAR
ncbi:hypothetical protein KEM52_002654 [Ascosphaera acerosa]|nr:hypothetical protein KEM52_002654 [Ascosphaera acerosa]